MKRVMTFATVLMLTCTVPVAQAQQERQGDILDSIAESLTKENVGKAVGGILGGVLGSQIGGGSGKTAATIVGALAGYWLGGEVGRRMQESDRRGLARTTATAIDTGRSQTWVNPDTGVRTEVQVQDASRGSTRGRIAEVPRLQMINEFYVADSRSNVRGGPGTGYAIVDQLETNEHVPVVGRVTGENWYMVARDGRGYGFVYAPLLNPAPTQVADANAIRANAGEDFGGAELAQPECTLVTQKVTMPDGETASEQFRACRTADGSWEVV